MKRKSLKQSFPTTHWERFGPGTIYDRARTGFNCSHPVNRSRPGTGKPGTIYTSWWVIDRDGGDGSDGHRLLLWSAHPYMPQAKGVLPGDIPIRGARARHPATVRPQNRVTARGYRLPAVDEADFGHGCEPRPRTGVHRRGGSCACAGTGTGWRAFGWGGGCEPQTPQTLFSGRTVAKCCARAPRIA